MRLFHENYFVLEAGIYAYIAGAAQLVFLLAAHFENMKCQ